ncbi:MAG TPA: dethiobiotin synthase [Candidatus Acidoferrales bacterium]|nr:dethiobiotin synthase [Candidatus Acidoferrales bacterium]
MGRRFLITGTGARVGKTTVGCALAFAFKARGMRVGVMKPCETGCAVVDGILEPGADARALAFAAASATPLDVINPYRYRSPLAPPLAAVADGLPEPDLEHIARCYREIAAQADTVIVEGWGALDSALTTSNGGRDFADLAAMLDLEVVAVAATTAGYRAATARVLDYAKIRGLKLAGYILCDVDPPTSSGAADVKESDARLLGRMRYREPLAKSIVEKLL